MAATQVSGFIWYELMTDDLEEAISFYSKVVGWEVNDSGVPGMRYVLFGKSGKPVGGMMSWSSLGMQKPTEWKGHIQARDVEVAAAAVVAGGGTLHRPTQQVQSVGRFALVSDPQGAEYLLFQPDQQQAPPQPGPHEAGAVGWCELSTTNWEQAWEFYSSHYGWTKDVSVDMGPMGLYQTFMMSDGRGGGMMNLPASAGPGQNRPGWLFYITVEDIQAAAQRVRDNDGQILYGPVQVPGGAWTLRGLDSQGGSFALTARK